MPWPIVFASLLLTAGFAKLSIVIWNHLLARRHRKTTTSAAKIIQLSLIPVYAFLVINLLGEEEYRQLFTQPAFEMISLSRAVLFVLGAIGLILLIHSTIVYQMYRPPRCQIANDSRIIDFRDSVDGGSWRETLVGERPMRRIALLPGNQQFTVEVSTKTFLLPRVPAEWDGLSIVHFADTHFRGAVTRKYFEAVCEQADALKPDLFVFTGDLLDKQSLLEWLPETFGRLKARDGQYFILGNHDWYQDAPAIRKEFERCGWIDLAGRTHELVSAAKGPSIILAGDETPWMGSHPQLNPRSKDLFHILLSHTPDNIIWAREHGIDLMLAGHTHGGQIRLPVLGPVYSPSRFGCRFASGVFWLEPTLLYVSRGLSGREPIRYQCVPELIKIVLSCRKD